MPRFAHISFASILLLGSACSAGDDAPVADATSTATTAVVTTSTTEPPPALGPPMVPGFDPGSLPLSTPRDGVGIRPLLQWQSVSGAHHYGVYLYAPSGEIYWAWTGFTTSVHVGGEPVLADDVPGPDVVQGMTWGVVAYDDALLPIAASERREIAP